MFEYYYRITYLSPQHHQMVNKMKSKQSEILLDDALKGENKDDTIRLCMGCFWEEICGPFFGSPCA